MPNYNDQATAQVNPEYAARRAALQNSLASTLAGLDASKTGINQNYDNSVNAQNMNNTNTKNNYSNGVLGRGMDRSSIATTGLGELDVINNNKVGLINQSRANELNGVEANKALNIANTNNTIGTMEGERASAVSALARQLEQQGNDNAFRDRQLASDQAYKNASLAFQREQMNNSNALEREKMNTSKGSNVENDSTYQNAIMDLNQPGLSPVQRQQLAKAIAAKYGVLNDNVSQAIVKQADGYYQKAIDDSNGYSANNSYEALARKLGYIN